MKPTLIPVNEPTIGDLEKKLVQNCLDTGWLSSSGPYVKEFEEKFAHYCDCQFGTTTTNGTTAIHLALKSLDVQPGDEILVPSFTMAGTLYPIIQCGAIPVFVDCELDTFNIAFEDLKIKLTSNTKGIIVVHLYGHPADMDPISNFAKENNLWIIEDAAEAHGATYKNKKAGSMSDVACFSFYANKIITTGEGGMVVTNREDVITKARRLKDLAHSTVRFTHDLPEAYNYRMTNIQAALGLGQLKRIEDIIQQKIKNANSYHFLLNDCPGIILPTTKSWARNVFWMYAILLKESVTYTKEWVMDELKKLGVETRSFFYPLHRQKAFSKYGKNDCPITDNISARGFYLPSGQALTPKQIEKVAASLKKIMC